MHIYIACNISCLIYNMFRTRSDANTVKVVRHSHASKMDYSAIQTQYLGLNVLYMYEWNLMFLQSTSMIMTACFSVYILYNGVDFLWQ